MRQITYLAGLSVAIVLQATCSISGYSKLHGKDLLSRQLWFKWFNLEVDFLVIPVSLSNIHYLKCQPAVKFYLCRMIVVVLLRVCIMFSLS